MQSKIIQQGAEAIISLNSKNQVLKNRISKGYRLKEIDQKLRKLRTRSETKIINKLNKVIPVPKILESDEKTFQISMQYIQGKKLSEHLENLNYQEICKQIAENISKLHDQDIIHGDLTTSNMIYINDKNTSNSERDKDEGKSSEDENIQSSQNLSGIKKCTEQVGKAVCEAKKGGWARQSSKNKVYFIDFGLAFHSHKIEDKAVDLHLLKQALEAKHFKIADQAIKIIIENYKANQHKEIIERINIIEKRGRYKDKH